MEKVDNSSRLNENNATNLQELKKYQKEIDDTIDEYGISEEKIANLKEWIRYYSEVLEEKRNVDMQIAELESQQKLIDDEITPRQFIEEFKTAFKAICAFSPSTEEEALMKYNKICYMEELVINVLVQQTSEVFDFAKARFEFFKEKDTIDSHLSSNNCDTINALSPYSTLKEVADTFKQDTLNITDKPGYAAYNIDELLSFDAAKAIFDEILFSYYESMGFPVITDENNKKALSMTSVPISLYTQPNDKVLAPFIAMKISEEFLITLINNRKEADIKRREEEAKLYINFGEDPKASLEAYDNNIQAYVDDNKEKIMEREHEIFNKIYSSNTTINFSLYDALNLQRIYYKNQEKKK